MAFNPLDPATLRALQDLRAKTQARIDLVDMTYTIPFLETRCLIEYLDERSGKRTKYEEHEVFEALRTMKCTQTYLAEKLDLTRSYISAWIAGTKKIPRIHFVKIMRVIEGAQ
jgi:DNA-binding MarR family transcriptional regulator